MIAPFLVRGDPLPELAAFSAAEALGRPRGLLWGVDLRACATRKQARRAWHDAAERLKAELDAHPEIRRVCLACTRPSRFPQRALVGVPAGLALRLHTDLERDRARYVSVLVLDLTDCSDPGLLRDRLDEALTEPGRWSDLTLAWEDVAESRLRDLWASNAL